jgi:polyisoprenyl-teichoic acid--peptidoglycan teichoic acid transferase
LTQVDSYSPRRARRAAGQAPAQGQSRSQSRSRAQSRGQARGQGDDDPGGGADPDSSSVFPDQPEPSGEAWELERRGSHATAHGQGFSWVLAWTILGALIPGTGLIAAGWRRLGGLLLFLLGLAGLVLAALALVGNPIKRVESLAVDPQKLLVLALVAALVPLVWVIVIVLTNTQLRRFASLSSGQSAFSSIVVLALVVAVGLPAYEISHYALIQRDLISSVFKTGGDTDNTRAGPNVAKADPWAAKPRENLLLIGSDAGADRTGVRPDTLILASIDTKTGDTVLFSLPRNLERVPFPAGTGGAEAWPEGYYCPNVRGGHECLLNAIWTWASGDGLQYYKKYKNPGLRATEDAVEGVTGLKVDTYAMLNLKGFAQFINAIGGLRVNVDERLPINGNSENPNGTTGYIEKGKNKRLDGFQTLWFARSRWSTNDYDRMRRQRCVIGDVVSQADPVKMGLAFPKIAAAAKNNLSSGIKQEDLQAWVDLSQRIKGASVRSLPFTDQVIANRTDPDFDQIRRLVTKALKPVAKPTPSPTPSVSASASSTVKKKAKKKLIDPSKAQDIKDVC